MTQGVWSGLIGVILGAAFAFALPGYFLSGVLRSPDKWISSFCLSLVVLFHVVFWLGVLGVRLAFAPVFAGLVGLTLIAVAISKLASPDKTSAVLPRDRLNWRALSFWIVTALLTAVVAFRSTWGPLSGWDTPFRWDFLSQQIFRTGRFDFYPPRTVEHFREYFYVDGIPPLVSFVDWWLYASLGRPWKSITGLFVTAQFLCILRTTIRLGESLESREAGRFAAIVLSSAPLFVWAVVMGQETGLTALSLGATLYFITEAARGEPLRRMILAGLTVSVAVLARDYGGAFVVCGVIAGVWYGIGATGLGLFVATAALAAGPWYVRNALLTGNPFYSNPVGELFPVNPVHVAILRSYAEDFGFDLNKIGLVGWCLCYFAPVPLVLGIFGCCREPRRLGALSLCIAIVVLLWVYSVPQTAGNVLYSMRVLSPAWLLLSVASGVTWASLAPGTWWKRGWAVVPLLVCAWAIPTDLYFPRSLAYGVNHGWLCLPPVENKQFETFAAHLAGFHGRMLSDTPYTHTELVGSDVDAVPVWSPEVRFLFEPGSSPAEMRQRLRSLGIELLEYRPAGPSSPYLAKSPFYAGDASNWKLEWQDQNAMLFRLPPLGTPGESAR